MATSLRVRPSNAWDMVRYAEPAEFDDVADLLLRANRQYQDALPTSIHRAYMNNLRALMSDPVMLDRCEIMVVGQSGAVLGCIAFYPDAGLEGFNWPKGWAGMRALAVDPAARGLGLGRRLAEAAIGRARAFGTSIVCLHNATFQAPARKLYLDLGFVRCPQYDFDAADVPAFSPDGGRQPVEAFALRLT
jgi:GNAT superfamily N-acetyltransferase